MQKIKLYPYWSIQKKKTTQLPIKVPRDFNFPAISHVSAKLPHNTHTAIGDEVGLTCLCEWGKNNAREKITHVHERRKAKKNFETPHENMSCFEANPPRRKEENFYDNKSVRLWNGQRKENSGSVQHRGGAKSVAGNFRLVSFLLSVFVLFRGPNISPQWQ